MKVEKDAVILRELLTGLVHSMALEEVRQAMPLAHILAVFHLLRILEFVSQLFNIFFVFAPEESASHAKLDLMDVLDIFLRSFREFLVQLLPPVNDIL